MEVILRQAVDNLGHPGDIVDVSSGYARNFLLPRGVAYEATAGNKKRIAQEKERLEAAENSRRDAAGSIAKRLEALAGYKKITAPVDGVVTSRGTDVGALINAGGGAGPPMFVVS